MPKSIIEMSDEEFLATDPSDFQNTEPETEVVEEVPTEEEVPEVVETPIEEVVESEPVETEEQNEEVEEVTPTETNVPAQEDAPNYEELYKQLMKPFKANGQEITLKSPEELIRLAQMGAGYGKKMQQLQPVLRLAKSLEAKGLMNEEKLNYLIDLQDKRPEAIAKLFKESGIDPLDLNVDEADKYVPQNHQMSESQYNFTSTLQEINNTQEGRDLVGSLNTWDDASINALVKNPSELRTLYEQKTAGIFDLVSNEVNRRRVLGYIPPEVSAYNAYVVVGREMASQHQKETPKVPEVNRTPRVLDTRAAIPKPILQNADKVKVAAPTKSAVVKKPSESINYISMSDEEFAKLNL